MHQHQRHITLSIADGQDRESIYALRHQVYARELGQHPENDAGVLKDRLDEINTYLVAKRRGAIVGFVAVTPPSAIGYSLDKYFTRAELAFASYDELYEVRLLTVVSAFRNTQLAALLMYAALRYVESRGARTIAAIGRLEVLGLYKRAGLGARGLRVKAGAVTYELMAADISDVRVKLKPSRR